MKKFLAFTAVSAFALSSAAHASDVYVSGSFGLTDQSTSSNSGQTGAFTTGNLGDGTTLDVAAGTAYGWDTAFDGGSVFAIELGKKLDSGLRFGLEGLKSEADVDTHTDVTLGGGAIGGLDAASIASSPDPLGVTVAQVVADGQGDISQTALFVNAYYDFNKQGTLQPYLGVGVGLSDVEVDYRPSAIQVIDDSQTKLAYQAKAGVTVVFDSPLEVFAEVAYRATDDIDASNELFPGNLEIENEQTSASLGLRFKFE